MGTFIVHIDIFMSSVMVMGNINLQIMIQYQSVVMEQLLLNHYHYCKRREVYDDSEDESPRHFISLLLDLL